MNVFPDTHPVSQNVTTIMADWSELCLQIKRNGQLTNTHYEAATKIADIFHLLIKATVMAPEKPFPTGIPNPGAHCWLNSICMSFFTLFSREKTIALLDIENRVPLFIKTIKDDFFEQKKSLMEKKRTTENSIKETQDLLQAHADKDAKEKKKLTNELRTFKNKLAFIDMNLTDIEQMENVGAAADGKKLVTDNKYFNALVQFDIAWKELYARLQAGDLVIDKTKTTRNDIEPNITLPVRNMLGEIFKIRFFFSQFRNMIRPVRPYNSITQHDAGEGINMFLQLSSASRLYTSTRFIIDNALLCEETNLTTPHPTPLNIILLFFPIKQSDKDVSIKSVENISLQSLLDDYLQPQAFSNANAQCDSCGKNHDRLQTTVFRKLPNIFIIQLMRFGYDIPKKTPIKYMTTVQLPDSIDLDEVPQFGAPQKHKYDLHAVIVHNGITADSGHYATFVRTTAKKWVVYNDSAAAQSIQKNENVFSSAYWTPYILFYKKYDGGDINFQTDR